MGNISAGHELISRTAKKEVFGKLVQLSTKSNEVIKTFLSKWPKLLPIS